MLKTLILSLAMPVVASPAFAGPAERLGAIDRHLDRLERNGAWAQGSRADRFEDRIDRREDKLDRRESRRDEAIDLGPRDVFEDKLDRAESVLDRRENRRDRRRG